MSNAVPDSSALDVTVVTPTFNRASLIERALDSIRLQTRQPTQIIVVDDGSSDGTPDVVRAWAERYSQPVLVTVMERNGGPAAARNRGIQLAATRYVAFLDSDDAHAHDTLETLCSALDRHRDAVFAFGDATVVWPTGESPNGLFGARVQVEQVARPVDGGLFALNDAFDTLLTASIIPTSATCFRRDVAVDVGAMPEGFRSGEDWLFFLRMAQRGPFVFTPRDLAFHHRHDDNLTSAGAAEFVARQKLVGLLALDQGTVGITLAPPQRERIAAVIRQQTNDWRYHLSRLGWPAFIKGLREHAQRIDQSVLRLSLSDVKSLARAWGVSMGWTQ